MQRAVNSSVKLIFILIVISAVWLVWAAFGRQVGRAVFSIPENTMYDRSAARHTSTDYRFEAAFQDTLKQYTRFRRLYQKEISTPVPGLQYTRIGDSGSVSMVPQGLCIAGDYMLISAYDGGEEAFVAKHSVLYVMTNEDPKNRTLLTTIELPDINHVGGLAFDGRYVWIAKSTTQKCSAIDYRQIQRAVRSGRESYPIGEYTAQAGCGATASFLTYYNEKLWVGTFRSRISGKGSLQGYEIEGSGKNMKLVLKERVTIPAYANGTVFAQVDGRTCVAVTASNGRFGDSRVYLYEVIPSEGGSAFLYQGVYTFPPMAEEMASDGEHTYFLFESAATGYSTPKYWKCDYPVDRICGVSTRELFSWAKESELRSAVTGTDRDRFRSHIDCAYLDPEKYFRILALQYA